jgi:hypothetical protein
MGFAKTMIERQLDGSLDGSLDGAMVDFTDGVHDEPTSNLYA